MSGIDVGQRVPDFELPDQDGRSIRLSSVLGQGPVVLYFYPKDYTPGCTTQACSFRDADDAFAAAGAIVLGISSDSVDSHRSFATHHRLGFRLLSDIDGKLRERLGIPRFMGFLDGRVTLVLDREGVVQHRFNSMLKAKRHVEEALATVQRLRG
jgi:peroxiredoxin Q/BCP